LVPAHQNPFRTQRVESLDFRFPEGLDWPRFLARVREFNYTAAIVGPDGAGKTTLLEGLGHRLRKQGIRTRPIFVNHDHKRVTPTQWRAGLTDLQRKDIVLFDGADLLNMWTWWQLLRLIRQSDAGLIITAHREGLLPTLIHTGTDFELFRDLLVELLGEEATQQLGDLPRQLFEQHHGNVRDALRDLYDAYAINGSPEQPACGARRT